MTYVDLPVYGSPMTLGWKKHRMCRVYPACATGSWVDPPHRYEELSAHHARRQVGHAPSVGEGRTVSEVAKELSCDWHIVNDALLTYGTALLEVDRKRLNQTNAIGLDETFLVKANDQAHSNCATTVCDVANHQIIEILPSRNYVDIAA